MTIHKGSSWGVAAPFPVDAPIASSNKELLQLVNDGERLVGLRGGDLFRTAGGGHDRLRQNDPTNLPMHLPVDVIDVELDEARAARFVTHMIGHSRTWRIMLAAMNVDFWRSYQLGPRSHPGDGVIDLYTARLGAGDLFKVAPRAKLGTHVPHPRIELQRSTDVSVVLPKPIRLWTDDVSVGLARSIRCTVQPDQLTVVV